jgi:hypothetical protein
MTLTVAEPRVVRVWIDRDHHGLSGEPMTIAIESEPIPAGSAIDSLAIDLHYDGDIMIIDEDGFDVSGTPLEGWSIEINQNAPGVLRLLLVAPSGRELVGGGELLRFIGRMYLGRKLETEISLDLSADARCLTFLEEPGFARHDTVCGLNFRLIEYSLIKYAAPRVVPNPAHGVVSVQFGLGLDGATRLEIYDAMGRYVGTLVEGELGPGAYSVEWDVSGLGAGVYHLRLTSGAWREMGRVVVE